MIGSIVNTASNSGVFVAFNAVLLHEIQIFVRASPAERPQELKPPSKAVQ